MQIDKGIPFHARTPRSKYPFADMEPGDSILFQERPKAESARISSRRFMALNQPTWVFEMRRVEDGWRLWRTM